MTEGEGVASVVETKSGRNRLVVVGLTGGAFGLLVGVLIGMQIPNKSMFSPSALNQNGATKETVVLNESATAVGVITAVNGNSLVVVNSSGQSKTFELAPNFYVYKYPAKNLPASVFQDVSALELNKDVVLNLSGSNAAGYLVTTVTYLEPSNEASGSAK